MEDLAEYTLRLCQGLDYAEVRFEDKKDSSFILKNGVPELSGFDRFKGLGLRILRNGALGFASTNNLSKTNIKKLVNNAIKLARTSKKLVKNKLEFSKENVHLAHYSAPRKINPEDVSPEEKLDMLLDLDKALVATKIKAPLRYLVLRHTYRKKVYVNSEGSRIISKLPKITFFWFLTVFANSKSAQRCQTYRSTAGFEVLKNWKIRANVMREMKLLNTALTKGKKPPKGKVDVICGPEVTGIAVHESVGHPYEADRIFCRESAQAGESFVTEDMINTKIGSDLPTVYEDPTIPKTAGYYLYDDEGVKARKRILMKKGVINELLHNRETSRKVGLRSNGSARATNYSYEPIVRMANTYVGKGSFTKNEIIETTKKGVFINNFMEWNIDDKRFNQKYVGSEAYYVENGELKHPILNPIIEITTPKFWSSIDAIGRDIKLFGGNCGKGEPMQSMPVTMGGPAMRLKNLRLG